MLESEGDILEALRSGYGWRQHRHKFRLERVTLGTMTRRPVYHFRCGDLTCRWPVWCYKHEFWSGGGRGE